MKVRNSAQLCDLYAEMFTAYLDRSLPAHLERQLSEHIETCSECSGRLEGMKRLIAHLSAVGTPEASPELAWAIKRAVGREARREAEATLLKPLPFLVSAAAAAALLVAVSLPSDRGVSKPFDSGAAMTLEPGAAQSSRLENFVLPPRLGEGYRPAIPYATASRADTARASEASRVNGLAIRF